jgi:ABC-2 type transport system permease protein
MIRAEFAKQFPRLRTYAIVGVMVGIPMLLPLIFKVGSGSGEHGGSFVGLARQSGLNMAILTLDHMAPTVFLGVGAILAGSVIAEEASWGTLGYLLVRPVSRGRLLASKLAVVGVLTLIGIALAATVAALAGVAAFGWEAVETPSAETVGPGTALERLAIAMPYIAWNLTGIMSVAFYVSTRSNSPLSAAATAFGVAVIAQILNSFSAMGDARIVLPTHYWTAWQDLFASPANWDNMQRGLALQVPYVVGFLGLAFWSFQRKDVLT